MKRQSDITMMPSLNLHATRRIRDNKQIDHIRNEDVGFNLLYLDCTAAAIGAAGDGRGRRHRGSGRGCRRRCLEWGWLDAAATGRDPPDGAGCLPACGAPMGRGRGGARWGLSPPPPYVMQMKRREMTRVRVIYMVG
jgi:hypothetical protein